MTLKTRKPTGKPPWPMLLLAGCEKSGKSWSWAAFSSSDLIDRTFVIEVGEGAADAYGAMPGARFEIVEHDGSFRDIGRQIKAASSEPTSGKPHCIVVDSMTEVWDLLTDEQQHIANMRAKKKNPNSESEDDAVITMDQWNVAKKRWRALIDVLREHNGPVVLTSRFEQTVVMGPDDKPTKDRLWKVRAEKNLPFEVDAIVEMPRPREYRLTGVRSLVLQLPPGGAPMPTFTIEGLLRKLGLPAAEMAPRNYTAPRPEALAEERAETQAAEQKALAAEVKAAKADGPRPLADLPRNANGSVNLSACTKAEKELHGLGQKNPDHEALVEMPTGEGRAVRSDAPSEVDEVWQGRTLDEAWAADKADA